MFATWCHSNVETLHFVSMMKKKIIMLTSPGHLDILTPHFYIVKLSLTGACIFLALQHRLETVLTSTHNLYFKLERF